MTRELEAIDVASNPDLLRIAEEVERTGKPRVLRRADEDLALVVPVPQASPRTRRQKTQEDYEAFRSAAGGWRDVDTDRLLKDVYESRTTEQRPPVEL